MKGVHITKALVVNEDKRRKLVEISNGLFNIRGLKVLFCKKGKNILGEHWHPYPEVRYLLKGEVKYKLKHILTGETAEFILNEGELLMTTGFIIHTGEFSEDSIMIDGSGEAYISQDFNDVQEKIWNNDNK